MRIGTSGSLLLAVATSLLAGCGSDATGPAGTLDAGSVRAQTERVAEIAQLPAVRGLIGTAVGEIPAAFARRIASELRPRAAVSRSAGPGAWLSSTLLGKTFVRSNGAWVADSTRADAPANGVHVVLYERGSDGTLSATVAGLLEAVDSSSADGSTILGIVRLIDTGGATVGSWRYVSSVADPDAAMSVTGSLGPADRALALADTMSFVGGSDSTLGGIRAVESMAAPFVDAGAQRRIEGASTIGAPVQVTVTVTSHGHEVRSETTITAADTAGTGREIFIDDRLAARMPPGSDSLFTPDGGAAPSSLVALVRAVDALAVAAPSVNALHTSVELLLGQLVPFTP